LIQVNRVAAAPVKDRCQQALAVKWPHGSRIFCRFFSLFLHTMSAVSFLICDPSPALQTFLQQLLIGYGFDSAAIKTTGNPQAAAEVAAALHPDFLITDGFAKESLSGIALFRAIQKHSAQCRFALMAQGDSASQAQEAAGAGALFLLRKPFSADAARSEVAKALDQLAPLHPQIAQRVQALQVASQGNRAAKLQLPSLPQFKPGDRVRYNQRVESIKYVILRRGELVVQLDGVLGFVEAAKVAPL
jgi:DNA-binding NarL/FixJ family response regulator